MVSEAEIDHVLQLATEASDAEFEKLLAKHPDVFAEQERRNQVRSAIRKKNHGLLASILSESPCYSTMLFLGNTLLDYAAREGDIVSCQLILEAGANIDQLSNAKTSVLFHVKLEPEIIKFLLQAGADPNNRNVFHVLTIYQKVPEDVRLDIIKLFMQHGLDINRVYMMNNDPSSLQTLLDRLGNSFPKIKKYLIGQGAEHAHNLGNVGAYDSANIFIPFEKLETWKAQL